MSSHFVALPVGQGDAFYLKRNKIHILVDGGRSKRALPGLLRKYTNANYLDIVVCTHNDADHANGLIGLFEELPVPIHEVWLPGTWTWRLEDLITDPEKFFDELKDNINAIRDVATLEECYKRYQPVEHTIETDSGTDASKWLLDVLDRQDKTWGLIDLFYICHYRKRIYPLYYCLSQKQKVLLCECINTAYRIKNIAEAALHSGARIRLFEFTNNPKIVHGGSSNLKPVNSCEVSPRKKNVPALIYLALTKVNKESLVFYAPEYETDNVPAVLFTADSDLAFRLNHIQVPSTNIIVTAPHHGSEFNATAYTVVNNWVSSSKTIWVRSDCRSKSRPGESFKKQPKRLCTLCNPPVRPKSAVRLHAVNGRWQRTRGTSWCSCL